VLTTETLHHAHFVRALAAVCPVSCVVIERAAPAAGFETRHAFEDLRDAHESAVWFGGQTPTIAEFAETVAVDSVNDGRCAEVIRATGAEMVVVFGTRKIQPEVIGRCPDGFVNLHGGNPERYRGLDSHLWAIYHSDFDGLVTTLHRVAPALDTGDIVGQGPVPVRKGMGLHELRAANTEVCIRLTAEAIRQRRESGRLGARPLRARGRYYSAMPAVLKDGCVTRFARYTDGLS